MTAVINVIEFFISDQVGVSLLDEDILVKGL